MHGNHPQETNPGNQPRKPTPRALNAHTETPEPPIPSTHRMGWTTWWSSRGARTRSHPELGRENPQRPWYCVSRHGRVGRRQVLQPFLSTNPTKTNQTPTHQTNHPDHELPHNAETNASDNR